MNAREYRAIALKVLAECGVNATPTHGAASVRAKRETSPFSGWALLTLTFRTDATPEQVLEAERKVKVAVFNRLEGYEAAVLVPYFGGIYDSEWRKQPERNAA